MNATDILTTNRANIVLKSNRKLTIYTSQKVIGREAVHTLVRAASSPVRLDPEHLGVLQKG